MIPTTTNPPPKPGHADTLRPGHDRLVDQIRNRLDESSREGSTVHTNNSNDDAIGSQGEMLREHSSRLSTLR